MPRSIDHLGREWNALGRENPYGAILTGDAGALADWSLEAFLETGKADAATFMAALERLAPSVRRARLLDFGCGVGRLTHALASYFQSAVGVDIAESMAARARELHASCANCEFIVNTSPDLQRFATGTFDVVYCRLVLQHMPPALMRVYIPELLRVLAPGGVLMFQLPEPFVDAKAAFVNAPITGAGLKRTVPPTLIRAYRRLKFPFVDTHTPKMAMFGMTQHDVVALAREAGAGVLAVEPDQSHGPEPRGFAYWLTSQAGTKL